MAFYGEEILAPAFSELASKDMPYTATLMLNLARSLGNVGGLSRMAMLKAVEAELKSERQFYLNIMLESKRQVTGSGNAGLLMDIVQVGLVIAATVSTGPAAIGLAAGASAVGSARNNEDILKAAFKASEAAEGKKAFQDASAATNTKELAGALTPSDWHKVNVVADQGLDGARLAASRVTALKKAVQDATHWYDWRQLNPPVGQGGWELHELKRKSTAWKHHGEGGTYAIEHDFSVATGIAYRDFLTELANTNQHQELLAEAEVDQQAFKAHRLTKYILNKACSIYNMSLINRESAYASLMYRRGGRTFGYDGLNALRKVQTATKVLSDETANLDDFATVEAAVKQRLGLA